MKNKLTQKQETYVNNLFAGMYQRDAYVDAYHPTYSLATVDANASRLANNEKVLARLAELREEAKSKLIADFRERQEILTEIARGNLIDYQETGADGGYLSIGKESPNTRAISEITSRTEYDKEGAGAALVTKVKLHNPTQAIDLLNKMDKIYTEGVTQNIDNRTVNINVSSEKAKELTERLIEGERTGGD